MDRQRKGGRGGNKKNETKNKTAPEEGAAVGDLRRPVPLKKCATLPAKYLTQITKETWARNQCYWLKQDGVFRRQLQS